MALWRVRATVVDRPGFLSVLTASLALKAVNILAVQVHTTEAGAVDDFLVDAPDAMTEAELHAAVERGRGRDAWIAPAEAQGLVDQPTMALGLAGRLVRDPDSLGDTLRSLLDADAVTWRASGPARPGMTGETMVLPDPSGGRYEVRRAAPGFTPAEYARAQALVEVAGLVAQRAADHAAIVLPGGVELVVRPAGLDDLPAIVAMHDRCSPLTRRRRYLTGDGVPPTEQLGRLLDPSRTVTLVVTAPGPFPPEAFAAAPAGLVSAETVVAMANLVVEGSLGEVSVVVEDRWQRQGLGTAVLRRMFAYAERLGCAAIEAHTGVDNPAMLRTLRRLGHASQAERDGGLVSVTVPLGPAAHGAEAGPRVAPAGERRTPASM